jgi:hypothetical protein
MVPYSPRAALRQSLAPPPYSPPLGHTASEDWILVCPLWMGCAPGEKGSDCQREQGFSKHSSGTCSSASPHLDDDSHDR